MTHLPPLPGEIVSQHIRCGKAGCRCEQGRLHGPYHYRIWRDGLKIRKVYIPLAQVPAVQSQCDAYKAVQARLRTIRLQREELTKNIKREWRVTSRLLRPTSDPVHPRPALVSPP